MCCRGSENLCKNSEFFKLMKIYHTAYVATNFDTGNGEDRTWLRKPEPPWKGSEEMQIALQQKLTYQRFRR